MLLSEWNLDDALAVRYEEGVEEGIGIGEERGVAIGETRGIDIGVTRTAKNMLAKGYSVAEVIEITDLSLEQVRALRRV
jgi:predicted transposase/invertase (TIGR01784 family)